jgi:propionyl-CoA carboxylase beta chain
VPVSTGPWAEASRFGTLFLNDDGRITAFDEKPAKPRSNQISMGIYLFNRLVLEEALVELAEAEEERLIAEYREKFANPYIAAEHGYVDEVIEASRTRPRLISALRMLRHKRDVNPSKKHGNIPL